MEKFVSVQQPSDEMLRDARVKNEKNSFCHNVRIMNEVATFFKSCFEVYRILVKQVDDMIIPGSNFINLQQYIARSRFNVSNLIFSMKNYMINYTTDFKVIYWLKKNANKYMIDAFKADDSNEAYVQAKRLHKIKIRNSGRLIFIKKIVR